MPLTHSDWLLHSAAEEAARSSSTVSADESTALAALAAEIKTLGGSPVQLLLEACRDGVLHEHGTIAVNRHRA